MIGLAEEKRVQISLEIDEVVPMVEADAALQVEAISSVIRNAIEATPEQGKLALALTAPVSRRGVCFSVEDSGLGIRAQVFEPFFSHKPAGTGLGLSIARGIVQGHGGSIRIAASAHGGDALHIQLPPGAAEKLSCPADPVSIADITDERSTGLATGEA